ncbi:hypothetical protein CFSAN001902_20475 [Salmonella enterica subsp. enterica serovar Heidelberg str. CFSAN001902]|nr:hypothetical protein [Salmonella enterica subsp. enterica serovar Heidelberg str. CFSAN001902]
MATAWAGAPSRQKRMNRVHRMTPPVRKETQNTKYRWRRGGKMKWDYSMMPSLPQGRKGDISGDVL